MSLNAVRANFALFSGDTPLLQIPITDADGTAVDLTGYTVSIALHLSNQSSSRLLWRHNATLAAQSTQAGVCTLQLAAADTESEGLHYYEIRATDGVNVNITVAYGIITIQSSGA